MRKASQRQQLYNEAPRVPFEPQVNGGEHLASEAIVDEKSGREELWSEVVGRGTAEQNE